MYMTQSVIHMFLYTISPIGPFIGMFCVGRLVLLGQKLISLRTNKADQKNCENWRRESHPPSPSKFTPFCSGV